MRIIRDRRWGEEGECGETPEVSDSTSVVGGDSARVLQSL